MSEPTLYRAAPGEAEDTYEFLVESGVLVPVERYEHGNIDGHEVRNLHTNQFEYWCPGAGIGGDDADPSLTCPKCRTGDWMHGIGGDGED